MQWFPLYFNCTESYVINWSNKYVRENHGREILNCNLQLYIFLIEGEKMKRQEHKGRTVL